MTTKSIPELFAAADDADMTFRDLIRTAHTLSGESFGRHELAAISSAADLKQAIRDQFGIDPERLAQLIM